VNDAKRLNKGSFIKSLITNTAEASITLFPILKRSTCTFKGLLNKSKSKKVDFILFNIAIIKGFLINKVLKALLYKKGL
jgi:predicted AAA+ superfamily ATPase